MMDEEPLIYKRLTLVALIVIGLTLPNVAHEAAQSVVCRNCAWDSGTLKAPIIIQTIRSVKEHPPEVKPVRTYGNGTCVPYARARTGIQLFGWAGSFLDEAEDAGYTVTEVPQIGCIVVTSESGGHVAVVEDISDEGIVVSEQNYLGLYQVSNRVIALDDEIVLGYIY